MPSWVPAFWRCRELKGALSIFSALGLPDTPAMAKYVMGLANALAAAENGAQEQFDHEKK